MSDDELLLNDESQDLDLGVGPRKVDRYDHVFGEIGDEQEDTYDDLGDDVLGEEDEFGGYQAGEKEEENEEDIN